MNASEILSDDPWIASSLLQKSIRRGDAEIATLALQNYLPQRGNAIWHKLIVIVCEDVGMGDLELVSKVIQLSLSPDTRAQMGGDHKVAVDLCVELANAVKDRSADYLWLTASRNPTWRQRREAIGALKLEELIQVATNQSETFDRRAIAAWHASGFTEKSSALRDGDIAGLFRSFKDSGAPELLMDQLELAARKTRNPLVVMLPVLLNMIQGNEASYTIESSISSGQYLAERVPLYALDKHTRIGKRAISSFVRECPVVRHALSKHIPAFLARSVGCIAVFYAEGVRLKQRLDWSHSVYLEELCLEADMLNAGVPAKGVEPIMEAVKSSLSQLDSIRRRLLEKAYPVAAQGTALGEAQA